MKNPINLLIFLVIATAPGLNHSLSKEIVTEIPEQYLDLLDWIEFVPDYFQCSYPVSDNMCAGFAKATWDREHRCTDARITVVCNPNENIFNLIRHEIGHIYDFCVLGRNESTEEFANNFNWR